MIAMQSIMRATSPLFVFALLAVGCAPTVAIPTPGACSTSSQCDDDEDCVDGRCMTRGVLPDVDGGPGGGVDGGGDPGVDAGGDIPPPTPSGEEICGNGRDDNGDGVVDEQCACAPGETQPCFGGAPDEAGVGICALGTQSCDASGEFGSWGECTGWTPAAAEACDGIDNNCDGTADEGCECSEGETRACYTGPPGTEGVGQCAPGSQVCAAGGWGPCDGSVLPGVDLCDGVDGNCDGSATTGCTCIPGSSDSCYETPSGIPGTGNPGVGLCQFGSRTCATLPGGGSGYGACEGAVVASSEICDNGLDEDCDTLVDEGCGTPTVDCTIADVLLLVDTTGSMSQEIAQIRARLTDTIVPGLAAEISDVRFAVARFDDFQSGSYGSSGDRPFALVQGITSSVSQAQAAVNTLSATGGGDEPESQVEALYQVATGAGLGSWVPPANCGGTLEGYPCFRNGATPIILLFTDANFHNGFGGAYSYGGISPTPHTYAQTVTALNGINAHVLGLMSGAAARDDLETLARDTGALASDGSPIVFDIGANGASLGTDVVRAVQSLCR